MAFIISLNVANFITLKLTLENYPLWHEQILALAESQDMVDLLIGKKVKPAMYTNTIIKNTSTKEDETKYNFRRLSQMVKKDHLLYGWIIGTLTEEALGLVIGL